jgi:tetratricopeptide (TPR) repeat protein
LSEEISWSEAVRRLIRSVKDKQAIASACFTMIFLVLIYASYSNITNVPPVLDDYQSFIGNNEIFLGFPSLDTLLRLSDTIFGWSRWLPMVTFGFDYWRSNGDISSFHLTNIAVHCLCMIAVVFLVYELLRVSEVDGEKLESRRPVWCAIWIAGVWALHPVQTNAVTYLVQRMTSIQALFYILSVAFYIRGRSLNIQRKDWIKSLPLYFISLFCSICAFLSKQNSAMLPVMLLLTELWFFNPSLLKSCWGYLKKTGRRGRVLYVLVFLIGLVIAVKVFSAAMEGYAVRYFTPWERVLTEARIVAWYIGLLLWPAPSRFSFEHDVTLSTSLWSPPTTAASLLFLSGAFWLILHFRKKFPLLTYGALWFFINLAIESTIVPLELIFEHRLYLPSVGLAMLTLLGLIAAFEWLTQAKFTPHDSEIIVFCSLTLLSSSFALATFTRNEVWRDPIVFYEDGVSKSPENPRSHADLAVTLYGAGRYDDAISEAELAQRLGKPNYEQYTVASNVIVGALLGKGDIKESIRRGEEIYASRPENIDVDSMAFFCVSMANAYLLSSNIKSAYDWALKSIDYASIVGARDQFALAESMLVEILKIARAGNIDLDLDGEPDPGALSVHAWMAKKLLSEGRIGEAKRIASAAVASSPEDLASKEIFQLVLRQEELNRLQNENWNFRDKYLKFSTSAFNIYMLMAHTLCKNTLFPAVRSIGEHFVDRALKIEPTSSDAHLLKGWYYFDRSQTEMAVKEAQLATKLNPGDARAWLGLGFFFAKNKQDDAAITAFEKTLELYPGYPKRSTILGMIESLRKEGKPS